MLSRLAIRSDLAVVALLIATVLVMVIPLPTQLLDVLLATNITVSVLLLMTAFYLRSAVQFSTLPAVILIATVFRLSLSIAVTRLVLTQADAGDIIRTFGNFVVSGNVVVGLVIFLIITVVQFVVITKGAERVAEVAARFSLDGLPGKQMSIDADLRAGEIDQNQARRRRRALEQESQLYGAMDGAMKFVKGDAIAGLVIIVVNLLGGLAIGTLQRGMSIGEAGNTYSILTVGDGLVAQVPALFIAITAGTVVTRVTGSEADSLGAEIASQLTADPRALGLGAVVAVILGFVPGFPMFVFWAVAAGLALLARKASRRMRLEFARVESEQAQQAPPALAPAPARIQLLLGSALAAASDPAQVAARLTRSNVRLSEQLGVDVPSAEVRAHPTLESDRFRLELDGVPLVAGRVPPQGLLLRDDPENAELAGIPTERGETLPGRTSTLWVAAEQRGALEATGVGFAGPSEALVDSAVETLRRHAGQFVGIQETRVLLARMEQSWGDLVKEALRIVPLQRIADMFRRLLEEGITLRNMRGLLEAMVEHGGREGDAVMLAEAVRGGLRRQICHQHADAARIIAAFIIDPEAEGAIRSAIRQSPAGTYLAMPEGTTSALVERIRSEVATSRGPGPVVLTALDVRRHLRSLLVNNGLDTSVLSFHDLMPEFTVQPLGYIRLPNETRRTVAQPRAAE